MINLEAHGLIFPWEEAKGIAHPKLISFLPFYLQVRLFQCHLTLTSFILASNFCASRSMEKSMPFLNQLLFLTPPFHSYSSQDCKLIFITFYFCTQYYLFSAHKSFAYSYAWRYAKAPHLFRSSLITSLCVFPQF